MSVHDYFLGEENELRDKFNSCLRAIGKLHENVSVLELKKIWDRHDSQLFVQSTSRYTAEGLRSYWLAVDRSIQFCDTTIMKRVAKYQLKPPRDNTSKSDAAANNTTSSSAERRNLSYRNRDCDRNRNRDDENRRSFSSSECGTNRHRDSYLDRNQFWSHCHSYYFTSASRRRSRDH